MFMSAPMALFALIIWIKNSYNGNYLEVKVNVIKKKEWIFISMLSIIFSIVSYFILKAINNNRLFVSTLSILTSMLASYFTFRRSKYYAICYAFNDIVLIVLWVVACLSDISYIPIVMCFVFFLIYDLYGFFNWGKIYKKQNN
jgi:nicotinamide mononucleotide transporter PnuC